MPRLSDIIEEFIKHMLSENNQSELQIQRNELASYFSCAPSQINYVLTTRFTTDRGYYIESKRGGGGCIVIKRIEHNQYIPLNEIVNQRVGDSITYDSAIHVICGFLESKIITEREANLIKSAVNDRTLLQAENRNKLRADILRAMVMAILL